MFSWKSILLVLFCFVFCSSVISLSLSLTACLSPSGLLYEQILKSQTPKWSNIQRKPIDFKNPFKCYPGIFGTKVQFRHFKFFKLSKILTRNIIVSFPIFEKFEKNFLFLLYLARSRMESIETIELKSKWQTMKQTMKTFHVEIFCFGFIFSLALEDVTSTLLAQDKFCMQQLNSTEICTNLSKIDSKEPILSGMKDQILVQVTTYNYYSSVISTLPLLISLLFISSWADRHKHSSKILLTLASFMFMLESSIVLFMAFNFNFGKFFSFLSS